MSKGKAGLLKGLIHRASYITFFTFITLFIPSLAFGAGCDGAGNCYIRSGATGVGNGSSWANAYTGFGTSANQLDPHTMARGVTYWIGNGSYGQVNFNAPDSGTQVITLEGAIPSNHGPATDWNSSYAGVAQFGEITIGTDYWTLNGQAVAGCTYPSNTESCYTIKLWNQSDLSGSIVTLGGGTKNTTLEYLELEGTGMTGGAFPNNSTADRCSSDGCGSVNDVGVNEASSPVSNFYFAYNYIHHIGTNMFMFNVTGTGMSVNQTMTWDHNWISYNHTGQNGVHTEAGSMYVSNFTVSYNVFQDISGSGLIASAGAATPPMSNWAIYGNLFFWDAPYAALNGQYHEATIDDGVIDFLGEQMTGYIYFYNNTLAGFNNSLVTNTSGAPFSTTAIVANSGYSTCGATCPTVKIYNNLWWDSAWITGDYPSYCQVVTNATCTQDYDAIYNGSVASGDLQAPSEAHGDVVTSTANPFVNFSASTVAGFQLNTPDPFSSNAGVSLASPYSTDGLNQVARGSNGTWDRGAEQLGSTSTATLQSIAVTPANSSIASGATQQFTATGTYSNGTTQNITTSADWTSSNTAVATIATSGEATAVGAGSTTISATDGSVSSSTTLTVTAASPTIQSITVTPANASIASGSTEQYTATATYSNGTTGNITGSAKWVSSNTAVATISSSGAASAVSAGSTTITATDGSVNGSTTLTVTAATLQSVTVTPSSDSISSGTSQQYTAMGHYSNGTTQNVTGSAKWASSNTAVATIGTSGSATGAASGSTTISATDGSVSGSTPLTVTAASPTLQSITVTPASASIATGTTQQYTATAHYSNGTTGTITSSVHWTSSSTGVATISTSGLASGVATGTTTIVATSGSVSGSTSLTVTVPPTLVSIAITPLSPTIAVGQKATFTATGTYSNGTKKNITTSVTWSSSNTSVATIGTQGVATAISSGTTRIKAAYKGKNSGARLTVQ